MTYLSKMIRVFEERDLKFYSIIYRVLIEDLFRFKKDLHPTFTSCIHFSIHSFTLLVRVYKNLSY